jgi:hypothetical protein
LLNPLSHLLQTRAEVWSLHHGNMKLEHLLMQTGNWCFGKLSRSANASVQQ